MTKEEIPAIAMQGPVEVTMKVLCITDKNEVAHFSVVFRFGNIPTRDEATKVMKSTELPAGWRLMNKLELWNWLMVGKIDGDSMPMPGNQEFEE